MPGVHIIASHSLLEFGVLHQVSDELISTARQGDKEITRILIREASGVLSPIMNRSFMCMGAGA